MLQFIVSAWDGTDAEALDRRMKARPSHFEMAKRLKENNNFVIGGAMLDSNGKMIGSTMIVQFESKEELESWLKSEPYITEKVWENVSIHPFRKAEV